VVFFLHRHNFRDIVFLHWIQPIPNILLPLIPFAGVYLVYKWHRRYFSYFDRFLIQCIMAMVIISILKYPIKYFFARHWPTSFCNNLSLIHHGVYGFNFFNIGKAYEAFPSGNAAKIFAIATIVWCYYPRWRWAGILAVVFSVIGVVGLYYHFVGDVAAGAFFGITVALLVLKYDIPGRYFT